MAFMEEKMKRPFDVLQYRTVAMGASGLFILAGIILFFVLGFNTGIDFGSGYSERVSIAPVGFTVSYSGDETAVLSADNGVLMLTLRGPEGAREYVFDPADYPKNDDIVAKLDELGLDAVLYGSESSGNLISGFGYPGYIRLSFAVEDAVIERSAEGFRKALKG